MTFWVIGFCYLLGKVDTIPYSDVDPYWVIHQAELYSHLTHPGHDFKLSSVTQPQEFFVWKAGLMKTPNASLTLSRPVLLWPWCAFLRSSLLKWNRLVICLG